MWNFLGLFLPSTAQNLNFIFTCLFFACPKTSYKIKILWVVIITSRICKFNNLGPALGTKLNFYTSVAKALKLKVKRFWWLIPTFVEVQGKNLCPPLPPPTPQMLMWSGKTSELKHINDLVSPRGIPKKIMKTPIFIFILWKIHLSISTDCQKP